MITPSADAITAARRESMKHGGSVVGSREHNLVHLCACGAMFRDADGLVDGDEQWQRHATEMELRAAYAVDAPLISGAALRGETP